jgi:hypothetical protein
MSNETGRDAERSRHHVHDKRSNEAGAGALEYDFRIHDAYIAFSAEIVRLALLAPAALSFLVVIAGKEATADKIHALILSGAMWFVVGLFLLFAAVLFGLIHRYVATDYMTTYIEFLRGKGNKGLDVRLKISRVAIGAAPLCLALGALLLCVGLGVAVAQTKL